MKGFKSVGRRNCSGTNNELHSYHSITHIASFFFHCSVFVKDNIVYLKYYVQLKLAVNEDVGVASHILKPSPKSVAFNANSLFKFTPYRFGFLLTKNPVVIAKATLDKY